MNGYFQRLISQSGLRVQTALLAPQVQTPAEPAARSSSASSAAADIQEVHHERIAGPGGNAPQLTEVPTSSSFHQPSLMPRTSAPDEPAARVETIPATDPSSPGTSAGIVIKENVVAIAPRSVPAPSSAGKLPSTPEQSAAAPSSSSRKLEQAVPDGISPEVMQEVMRWIAAGQPKTGEPSAKTSAASPARLPASPAVPQSSPAASRENIPTAPIPIPERVIEIVEEHFPALPTTAPSAKFAPAAAHRSLSAAPPAEESTARPVQVSIGSIHVRVDAPTPAPHRPARPEPAPLAPAARPVSSTKLRRHYLLPH